MAAQKQTLPSSADYTVAWFVTSPDDFKLAVALLDQQHTQPEDCQTSSVDKNLYGWGKIGKNNVIIASPPARIQHFLEFRWVMTFLRMIEPEPRIEVRMVSLPASALPHREIHKGPRLGDVIVSRPDGTSPGLNSYHMEPLPQFGMFHNKPSSRVLHAMALIRAAFTFEGSCIPQVLRGLAEHADREISTSVGYPGDEEDRRVLLKDGCNGKEQGRAPNPRVHFGIIASGTDVQRGPLSSEQIKSLNSQGCLAFETMAAAMGDDDYVIVGGIVTYADSYSNEEMQTWGRYGASTAAAMVKSLIGYLQ